MYPQGLALTANLWQSCQVFGPQGACVTHYRIYFFDSLDHISRALDIECSDDDEAIDRVGEHEHPFAIELWQGARRLRRFEPTAA